MNNKGQSLVTFVLLMPILFLVLFMVYEIGRMALIKNRLNGINYLAIDYGLDITDDAEYEEKIENLIRKNDDDIDFISINFEDDKLYINLSVKYKDKVSLFKSNLFVIKSNYVGYIEDNKKIIKKNR